MQGKGDIVNLKHQGIGDEMMLLLAGPLSKLPDVLVS